MRISVDAQRDHYRGKRRGPFPVGSGRRGAVRANRIVAAHVVFYDPGMTRPSPFCYFKTSPEIIRLAVMMYVRFPLSLRNVKDLLHQRGIEISHEGLVRRNSLEPSGTLP